MEKLCRLFYQSSWFFLSIAPSKLPVELVVRFFAAGKTSWQLALRDIPGYIFLCINRNLKKHMKFNSAHELSLYLIHLSYPQKSKNMASVLVQFNATCELMKSRIKEVYRSPAAEKKINSSNFWKVPYFFKRHKKSSSHVCFILDFSNLSDIIIIKKHFEIQMNLLYIHLL